MLKKLDIEVQVYSQNPTANNRDEVAKSLQKLVRGNDPSFYVGNGMQMLPFDTNLWKKVVTPVPNGQPKTCPSLIANDHANNCRNPVEIP